MMICRGRRSDRQVGARSAVHHTEAVDAAGRQVVPEVSLQVEIEVGVEDEAERRGPRRIEHELRARRAPGAADRNELVEIDRCHPHDAARVTEVAEDLVHVIRESAIEREPARIDAVARERPRIETRPRVAIDQQVGARGARRAEQQSQERETERRAHASTGCRHQACAASRGFGAHTLAL
jgi:hypothetical protein